MYTVNGAIMQREPLVLNDAVVIYRLNNVIEATFGDGRRIVDMLQANKDRFSTLIAAIQAAGLTDTLQKGFVKHTDIVGGINCQYFHVYRTRTFHTVCSYQRSLQEPSSRYFGPSERFARRNEKSASWSR